MQPLAHNDEAVKRFTERLCWLRSELREGTCHNPLVPFSSTDAGDRDGERGIGSERACLALFLNFEQLRYGLRD